MGTWWHVSGAAALLVGFRACYPVFRDGRIRAAAAVDSRGGGSLGALVRGGDCGVRLADRDVGGGACSVVQVLLGERAIAANVHPFPPFLSRTPSLASA